MATEKRLIDANALIDTLAVVAKKMARSDAQKALMGRVLYIIGHKSTVDAMEVVRCKDCKYHEYCDTLLYCGHTRGLAGSVSPESFCSYGERRTDA